MRCKKLEISEEKRENYRTRKNKIEFEVKNVVATASFKIDGKIDLLKFVRDSPDVKYNPEKFPGAILKIKEPRATYLVFSTGNMVITGLRKVSKLKAALNYIEKNFRRLDINFSDYEATVQNIVISGSFKEMINLNKGAIILDGVMYEPEVFPGLIYYLQNPKVVFLIFSTGKFVATGSRNKEDLEEGIYKVERILREKEIMIDEQRISDQPLPEFFV